MELSQVQSQQLGAQQIQGLKLLQMSTWELEPRPDAVFEQAEQTVYILPDIFVEEQEGRYTVRLRTSGRPPFQINGYYRDLLLRSQDPQVAEYLKGKLQQAEYVLWSISQRENTLLRCAQAGCPVSRRTAAKYREEMNIPNVSGRKREF